MPISAIEVNLRIRGHIQDIISKFNLNSEEEAVDLICKAIYKYYRKVKYPKGGYGQRNTEQNKEHTEGWQFEQEMEDAEIVAKFNLACAFFEEIL